MAPLAIGQSDLLPVLLPDHDRRQETVLAAAELENPQRLLVGRFDLAFVLIYLYPLLILALTYNVLSARTEQGTLVLALSQPVSLRTIVLGKLTLRFGIFLLVISGLAGFAAVVAGIDLGATGVTTRLLLWVTAVVAYGLVWFALATLVASFGRPSSTNAMALAAIWLAFVILYRHC